MKTNNFILYFLSITIIVLCIPYRSFAIPGFARQTNLSCKSCHTIFPELNAFGRLFKLNGYTLTAVETINVTDSLDNNTLNLLKTAQLSAMMQNSYTNVSKTIPGTQNNNFAFPQQLSIFLGGEITPRIGAFIQVTYDDQGAAFGLDNTDIRYADQTSLADKSLIYGLTLNNNPTVQDIWNSTPAWGFPYASSSVVPSPIASTLIEGGLAQNVAGLGIYALWNNLIYGEVSLYRSEKQGGPHPPDSTASGTIKSLAPYWRLALQFNAGQHYFEIGTFGTSVEMFPGGLNGLTDKFTDIGIDFNYEKPFGDNEFTLHASFIRENRSLAATFNSGGAMGNSPALNSFKVVGNYYINGMIGFSLGYFMITGDADSLLYAPAAFSGSSSGTPDSGGIIAEVNYLPWMNTKFGIQYVAYTKFNGSSSNYDGNGRSASDNNSVYVIAWLAF